MKKFYTLLAAAAVAVSASAALPVLKKAEINNLSLQSAATSMQIAKSEVKPARTLGAKKAAKAGPAIASLEGMYSQVYYSAVNGDNGGWQSPVLNVIQAVDETQLAVAGLWLGPADAQGNFYNAPIGKYDAAKGTLTFKAGATLVEDLPLQDGSTVTLYLYNMDMDYKALDTDIVFTYNSATRGFEYFCETDANGYFQTLLAVSDKSPEEVATNASLSKTCYDYIAEMDLNAINASMSYTWSGTATGDIEDYCYAYYEYDKAFDSVIFSNIFGFGYDKVVEFVVNKDAKTANLTDQVLTLTTQNGTANYMIAIVEGETALTDIPFAVTVETDESGSVSTLAYEGEIYVVNQDGSGYAPKNANIALIGVDVLGETAIDNVKADFDENAPVEYFNIQGVRVANPTEGLFIKRQGNKVAKVIL